MFHQSIRIEGRMKDTKMSSFALSLFSWLVFFRLLLQSTCSLKLLVKHMYSLLGSGTVHCVRILMEETG